jgi:hypothetical protein
MDTRRELITYLWGLYGDAAMEDDLPVWDVVWRLIDGFGRLSER